MDKDVKVSVICTAYNHEKYIRKCLEGFVMQKTNFKFEVLINDDCSTDNTAKIIREFEEKYPDIIKPIYQTENQYSKGVDINGNILLPLAKGKYIAFCEGDDYWCDENKLQLQYNFMEKNTENTMCLHQVKRVVGDKEDKLLPSCAKDDYSIEEILLEQNGIQFHTSSIFMKKDVYFNLPNCFYAKGFGDYQLYVYSAICGRVSCLSKVMSIYNLWTPGSWSSTTKSDINKRINFVRERKRMLEAVNVYYNRKYSNALDYLILHWDYREAQLTKNYKKLASPKFKKYRKSLSVKHRIKVWILARVPFLIKVVG